MKIKKNPAEVVIEAFGGPTATAKALGVSAQLVNYWKRMKRIPGTRQEDVLELAKKRGIELTAKDIVQGR